MTHTAFTIDWQLVALLLDVEEVDDREETVEKLIALQRGLGT